MWERDKEKIMAIVRPIIDEKINGDKSEKEKKEIKDAIKMKQV